MYYDDNFYDEPSEFETMIDEFKESLAKSVKEEYIAKMIRLEKENSELQEIKNNFKAIKDEHKEKMQELEHKIARSKDEVRRERLSVLMQDFEVVMYKVVTSRIEKPKCDKCNANRKIEFISPTGKKMYDDCECSIKNKLYTPQEFNCTEFKIDRDNKSMIMWYKIRKLDDYDYAEYQSNNLAKIIYSDDMKYEHLDDGTYFKSIEDCQKYCDWLNREIQG